MAWRAVPELRWKPRHEGSQDHRVPDLIRQARVGGPAAAPLSCQHNGQASTSPLLELFPGHTTSESLYLESEWAALVSYGLTVGILRDFLPVDAALNAMAVHRDTLRVARHLEAELGPEPVFPLAGCPDTCASLPVPPAPITVGIDGGYLRHWQHKQTHFVAIVGESVPRDGPAKRFGFVQGHDPKSRRHLAAALKGPGPAAQPGARVPLGW